MQPAQPVHPAPQLDPQAAYAAAFKAGVQSVMKQHFVPPAVNATQGAGLGGAADGGAIVYFEDRDPALAFNVSKMDSEWVAKYGCADFPAPNIKSIDRPWQQVRKICQVAGVPLPESFQDRPHLGGPSCPGCNWVAFNQGFGPMSWYLHQNDPAAPPNQAAKPPGRSNGYIHQVFKCGYHLAIAHCIVRRDRDAGRGDINVHLFERRQQS